MWNKPQLLNTIADLLILAATAALLAAALVWLVRVPSLPVRQVVFAQELAHTRRAEIEQSLPGALKGNFFSLNLEAVRGELEKLPWVRKVELRRVWSKSRCRRVKGLRKGRISSGWNPQTDCGNPRPWNESVLLDFAPKRPEPAQMALATRLLQVVRDVAAELEVSAEVLATRKDVEAIAFGSGAPDGSPLLRGWRRNVVGERLLAALS